MGKYKAFKMVKVPPSDIVSVVMDIDRAKLQEIIEQSITEDLQSGPHHATRWSVLTGREDLVEELRLMAATVDRIGWGRWVAWVPHTREECGCPLVTVADRVSWDELEAHPGSHLTTLTSRFTAMYDELMFAHLGDRVGIANVVD